MRAVTCQIRQRSCSVDCSSYHQYLERFFHSLRKLLQRSRVSILMQDLRKISALGLILERALDFG